MQKIRLECPAPSPDAWEAVLERMRGNLELEDLETDEEIDTADGATGRIIACKANSLRFTWQEPDWKAPSLVLLQLGSGVLVVEHDDLPDAAISWYEAFWQDELAIMAS